MSYIFSFLYFLVVSKIEEPPFIMHHLSPANENAVPETSSGVHMYEEIKDEELGMKKINQIVLRITQSIFLNPGVIFI